MSQISAYGNLAYSLAGGAASWGDPGAAVFAPDDSYTDPGFLGYGDFTNILKVNSLPADFSAIPDTATIDGLEIVLYVDGEGVDAIIYSGDPYIYLGTERQYVADAPGFWPVAVGGHSQPYTLGGAADKWGIAGFTPARLKVQVLGLYISVMNYDNDDPWTPKLDAVKFVIHYTEAAVVVIPESHYGLRHPRLRR